MLRSALEDGAAPWTDAAISGFIVDPDRKKMSKSKGNVVTPADILAAARLGRRALLGGVQPARHGCRVRPAEPDADQDRPPPRDQGAERGEVRARRSPCRRAPRSPHALDASMLADARRRRRASATKALDAYDHARALEVTESFFWTFCDDYLELVKERAYDRPTSGRRRPSLALRPRSASLLRLFAPGHPVRHRGGVVVVQRGLGAHRAVAATPARHRRRRRRRAARSSRASRSSASAARRPRRRRRRRRRSRAP